MYINEVDVYTINYQRFQDLLAGIISMKDLFFLIITLILKYGFGYLEGNYYSEIIYSLFSENEKFSSQNRKKCLKVYGKNPEGLELIKNFYDKEKEEKD